jgi:hypothetical protein
MKRLLIITLVILMAFLTACSGADETPESEIPDNNTQSAEEDSEMASITMRINNEEVMVTWENNESVKALAELASESPLVIDTSMYGGFEQVGSIGTTLPSSDVNTTTKPGDIVLYTGSNIVVFFGSNTWDYTKLGHIENRNAAELKDLLGGNNVKITFSAE